MAFYLQRKCGGIGSNAPGDLRDDPRASPAIASINSETAPATIIVAGNDPLHDEGVAYANALQAASVSAVTP